MNQNVHSRLPGFVLESADSVRFGPEYNPDEQERNRQILFGEMLCGLLMGEQFWTNAVFAFDSRGTAEVLGAVARKFTRRSENEQFLPFLISVYGSDLDTWTDQKYKWQNPKELFLRCYAHRLNNTHVYDKERKYIKGFQLSATPELDLDEGRRKGLAAEFCKLSQDGGSVSDLKTKYTAEEQSHLSNIFDIDNYFRSWLDKAGTLEFDNYVSKSGLSSPIRLNRSDWGETYSDGAKVSSLRYFLEKASVIFNDDMVEAHLLSDSISVLKDALDLPQDHNAFRNRSNFRAWLTSKGHAVNTPIYRALTELADGHYVRTQQSVLTAADREVTSPASTSDSSQAGENWASATMRACLKDPESKGSWQFINEIKSARSASPLRIDLDQIAKHFADYMKSPERRQDLLTYHYTLDCARRGQLSLAGQGQTNASEYLKRLPDIAKTCCNKINKHLSDTCGVSFQFNTNQPNTGAGSLKFVYLSNEATSQCTGAPLQVSDKQSEGSNHDLR